MTMVPTLINGRWSLLLPEHRANRPGWDWWERDALSYLHAMIRPGDVVWDVGAEEGDQSALYASWGAQMVLIEPSLDAWSNIFATFQANTLKDPVASFRGFVSDKTTVELNVDTVEGWKPGHGPDGVWRGWPYIKSSDATETASFEHLNENSDIPTVTLDDLSMERVCKFPDVIIVDVEGAEQRVLCGAERILTEDRPIWMISIHPEMMRDRYRDTPDDVLCHMETHGYTGYRLGFDHEHHWIFKPKP